MTETLPAPLLSAVAPTNPLRGPVGVVGPAGVLTDALRRRLGPALTGPALTGPDLPSGLTAVVSVLDGIAEHPRWLVEAARRTSTPWLPVRVEHGSVLIGPLALPGRPGCPTCAHIRRDKAFTPERRAVREQFGDRLVGPDVLLSGFAALAAAELVAGELDRLAAGGELGGARTDRGMLRLRLADLVSSSHRLLPEPGCPDCGDRPDDSADAARITLVERPTPKPGASRVRDLRGIADELVDTYVDEELGLIRGLQRSVTTTCPTTGAPMGLRFGVEQTETGFGRELSFELAKLTAIAEGVERYGGVRPAGKRTACTGSYRELADRAIDPRVFGLHDDEQYGTPGFPFQRFTDDLPMAWVWAWSFARDEPVLVPETFGYYRIPEHVPGTRPIAYEISNGCALGGCLEEAILHGILEVAERDAFLMTWYAQLPARRLDLDTAVNRNIPLLVERLEHRTGYQVLTFDTTVEHGIPAVWTMAVDPRDRDDAPKALCAAGAALDPERAIMAAVLELAPLLEWRIDSYPGERAQAAAMLADPAGVRTMHDHSLVNAHPAAFDRYDFLLGSGNSGSHAIADSFRGAGIEHTSDLTGDLRVVLSRFLDRGQDVLVVDQTAPEHAACGFSCVKVLIPGMVPMTFGHWARRTTGLPRLGAVPVELGHRATPLLPQDVNPYPHPFP
ncbi:TOMM precursor leader peptide-binding protein [Actinomycetes bacterium KLBMP 9759]